jgi:hypothetical protein
MFTPAQSRAARGILDWTQDRLAAQAAVSLSTVKDFESGRRTPIANNLAAIQRALEGGGVEFTNGNQPGVRLSLPAAASGHSSKPGLSPKGASSEASDMAAHQIDKLGDASATAEERKTRKRRLLKGPTEFRDMRVDLPAAPARAPKPPAGAKQAARKSTKATKAKR